MARIRAHDYDDRRRRILDIAAALIAEHGFDGASMSMIAARASLSKPGLYHYYDSKEALLFDILHSHLTALRATIAAVPADLAPEARLRALIQALLAAYRDADDRHKAQINDLPRLPREQQQAIKAIERDIIAPFREVIAALNPRLEPHQLTPVTMSLFGILNWQYTWFQASGRMSLEDYGELVARLFLDGLKSLP